jgi:colanic acid biosynthesis glycosyl transferase WcaI
VTIEPPLFSAPAALGAAYLCGAKSVLHIQDYEVDAAFDLGLLKGGLLKKMVLGIEGFLLKQFDLVSTISSRMVERALSKGLFSANVYLFPNWADTPLTSKGQPSPEESKFWYRKKLGIPEDAVIALYSGNMGAKQGLEVLAEVAKKFQGRDALLPPVYYLLW